MNYTIGSRTRLGGGGVGLRFRSYNSYLKNLKEGGNVDVTVPPFLLYLPAKNRENRTYERSPSKIFIINDAPPDNGALSRKYENHKLNGGIYAKKNHARRKRHSVALL